MDERMLFQTIHQGLTEAVSILQENQPTLRDQFAMSIIAGALPTCGPMDFLQRERFVNFTYDMADQMIAARQPTTESI